MSMSDPTPNLEFVFEIRLRFTRVQMIRNTPMHRMGTPEEIAAAVLFLASNESAFVTGIDFLVDGGAASF